MTVRRVFNTTGPCVPELHYMVDTTPLIDEIVARYIAPGHYFTINQARQYGKTTTLELLRRRLETDHVVISLSFQGSESMFASYTTLVKSLSLQIADQLRPISPDLTDIMTGPFDPDLSMPILSQRITQLCALAGRPVVLLVDEVDAAADHETLSSFLGLLRTKYIERTTRKIPTFHSVALAGVHDIKNLRRRIPPDSAHVYNSPWNIAVPFTPDLAFGTPEITTMLADYETDQATGMDVAAVAAALSSATGGYPFLVSRLCQIVAETGLPWNATGLQQAVTPLLKETNPLFDDLIKNIENNPELDELLSHLLLDGDKLTSNADVPTTKLGLMYGILSGEGNLLRVSNPIFETLIYAYLTSSAATKPAVEEYVGRVPTYVADDRLDMDRVCSRFAQFLHSEYRDSTAVFVEKEARLLFLSFLTPVINGSGHYSVEAETRGNRRMDVIVFFRDREYIVELKIWDGQKKEAEAFDQLAAYLHGRHQAEGWLISFTDQRHNPRADRVVKHDGCTIHEITVAYKATP